MQVCLECSNCKSSIWNVVKDNKGGKYLVSPCGHSISAFILWAARDDDTLGWIGRETEAESIETRDRVCRHCQGVYTGTAFAICSSCGRFQ